MWVHKSHKCKVRILWLGQIEKKIGHRLKKQLNHMFTPTKKPGLLEWLKNNNEICKKLT